MYLGDPYAAALTQAAAIGATVLSLDNTLEFLPSGSAVIDGQTVQYTAISGLTLTGVTGVTAAIIAGAQVVPAKQWTSFSQVVAYAAGLDASVLGVSLGQGGAFGFPGMPFILSTASPLLMGESVALDLKVTVPAGVAQEFVNWAVTTNIFYAQALGSSDPLDPTAAGIAPVMAGYVNRQDQALPQRLRLLPINRDISSPPAGFVLGQYVWRDDTEINAQSIIPSNWLTDPTTLGNEKFIAGIGGDTDLEPVGFNQESDSVYLEIDRGFYFTGPNGYYLPAAPQLDFLSSLGKVLQLSRTPQPTVPMFVGTYALDAQGFYEKNVEYRYKTAGAVSAGTNLPEFYYTLDRETSTVTLNKTQPIFTVFVGTITGESTDYFDLPIYPVDRVESVFVLHSDGTRVTAVNWTVDYNLGRITITAPPGVSGTSIAGTLQGETVMATCLPAVAVLYETGGATTRVLDTVDLNPAFAGISGGVVYLQHSRQEVASLVLACDKPVIDIPATLSSIIGLVAYGPVFFDGDYALLQVTAYAKVPGQVVQGAELEVIPDEAFTGSINYMDPTTETVTVRTGADGTANLIFRPSKNYGFYIPTTAASGALAGLATTTVANDTIVLPEPVAISQLYSAGDKDPWLVTLYTVFNNNPLLGMLGAVSNQGEVAWATSGTPGTVNYKTNGERSPWLNSSQLYYPVQLLDSGGRDALVPGSGFTGNVVRLVYGQSVPTSAGVGSYFLTFLQRTMLRIKAVGTNIESNSILLQMGDPALIDDEIWLILSDTVHGILNQYRLGWFAPTS